MVQARVEKIPRSVTLKLSTKREIYVDLKGSYHAASEKIYKALSEDILVPAVRRYGDGEWDDILELLRDEVMYVCQPYKGDLKYATMAMMMAGAIDEFEEWKTKHWKELERHPE